MGNEFTQLMEAEDKSYKSTKEVGLRGNLEWERKITEAGNLIYNTNRLPTHRRAYLIREALTTSDFSMLFGDVLDRQVLVNYKAVAPVWKAFTKQSTVVDFRPNYRFRIWGSDEALLPVVQQAEYKYTTRSMVKYAIQALKYGRAFEIDWEAIVNDDLGALQDTPTRFANAAIRTEAKLVTSLYANNVGAHVVETTNPTPANLYLFSTSGAAFVGDQINAVSTPLTVTSLQAAIQAMAVFTDLNGELIENRAKYLVVPPALEFTARAILTSTWRMTVDTYEQSSASAPVAYPTANPLNGWGLEVIVDPYLPIVDTSNGNTAWYLFADPSNIPALEFARLQGHEVPEIAMKASNKITVGGAPMSPMSGDFETDDIKYRVRIVNATAREDWRGAYMGGKVN